MSFRVILVTGANGALGRAIARAFLDESPENFVWLGIHRQRGEADKLQAQLPERCRCVQLDVTQKSDWEKTLAAVLAGHGRLDVLVNNAGTHEDGLLATMPSSAWETVLATNLDAAFHGIWSRPCVRDDRAAHST